MIQSKDRSYFIGASDTGYVMQSWDTDSFKKWWWVKQGFIENNFSNEAMIAGTFWEHRILDHLEIEGLEKDKQIIIGRLRVNLDGNTKDTIYEVKTYSHEKGFKVPLSYKRQVNVEMYATGFRKAYIVAYGLIDEDYRNFYRPVDHERISLIHIHYDEEFISEYLPRLHYLERCLDEGRFPMKKDFLNEAEREN